MNGVVGRIGKHVQGRVVLVQKEGREVVSIRTVVLDPRPKKSNAIHKTAQVYHVEYIFGLRSIFVFHIVLVNYSFIIKQITVFCVFKNIVISASFFTFKRY